jgi:predicted ester cyclase
MNTSYKGEDVALSLEHNKNLVYRFFTEGVTEGNLDIIDEVMDHDMMDHRLGFGNLSGTKGERELYSGAFPKAFPDGRADKIALIAEGDDVFWMGWGSGTHSMGPFMGIEASGKFLQWTAWDYFHVVDGKIVERWGTHAALNRMHQMGAITLPKPPHTERPVVAFSESTEKDRDHNKGLVWRFVQRVVNLRDLDAADEVMAPDVIDHRDDPAPAGGTAAIKRTYAQYHESFPDYRALYRVMIADGNLVFWWGTAQGTHSGAPFMGQAPSGRHLSWNEMTLFRIADGKIVEMWAQHDEADFMRQLGNLPPGLAH